MSIAIITLLVLTVLPISLSWVSGAFRHSQLGVVDNKNPRAQNAQLQDGGARAVAAQKNAWEALVVYTASIVALTIAAVDLDSLATYFYILIACRVLHGISYVLNQDIIRSIAFIAGYGICIYFFILAL